MWKVWIETPHNGCNTNLWQFTSFGRTLWRGKKSLSDENVVLIMLSKTKKRRFREYPLLHLLIEELELFHGCFQTYFRMSLGQFIQFNLTLACQKTLGAERSCQPLLSVLWLETDVTSVLHNYCCPVWKLVERCSVIFSFCVKELISSSRKVHGKEKSACGE